MGKRLSWLSAAEIGEGAFEIVISVSKPRQTRDGQYCGELENYVKCAFPSRPRTQPSTLAAGNGKGRTSHSLKLHIVAAM